MKVDSELSDFSEICSVVRQGCVHVTVMFWHSHGLGNEIVGS